VFLHSPHNQASIFFVSQVLLSSKLRDYFNDTDYLFWISSITSLDGWTSSIKLNAIGYPFIAIVNPQAKNILRRSCGSMSLDDTLSLFEVVRLDHLEATKQKEQNRLYAGFSSSLLAEQDDAYSRSLQKDLTKKKELERLELEKENKELLLQMQRKKRNDMIQDRIAAWNKLDAQEEKNINTKLLTFRLSNGTRHQLTCSLDYVSLKVRSLGIKYGKYTLFLGLVWLYPYCFGVL
jgi:hypothetical protein